MLEFSVIYENLCSIQLLLNQLLDFGRAHSESKIKLFLVIIVSDFPLKTEMYMKPKFSIKIFEFYSINEFNITIWFSRPQAELDLCSFSKICFLLFCFPSVFSASKRNKQQIISFNLLYFLFHMDKISMRKCSFLIFRKYPFGCWENAAIKFKFENLWIPIVLKGTSQLPFFLFSVSLRSQREGNSTCICYKSVLITAY